MEEIYGKGHVEGKHVKFKNKAGEPIEVAITARAKMDESGRLLYHEGIVHNISEALEDQRNRVLRNAAGGMCHYLNTHLMHLHGSQEAMMEEMESLGEVVEELAHGENCREKIVQVKRIMGAMHQYQRGVSNAYERIAEVTKAFNKAFLYREESYSTQTILDIFRSYGYEGDD
jgi:hypothetical protein